MIGRWLSWVIPGVVVAIGGVAVLDAVRSSDDEPAAASAKRERWNPVSSAQLREWRVVRLIPGSVTTDEEFGIPVTFTVPRGWYGYEGWGDFVIAKRPPPAEVNLVWRREGLPFLVVAEPGIAARALDDPLVDVLRFIRSRTPRLPVPLLVAGVAPIRIGGVAGRSLRLVVDGPPSTDVNRVASAATVERLVLLAVGRKTLLIRLAADTERERTEVNRILMSFRFPRSA